MIIDDDKIDEILKRRKERILSSKKPINFPRLKFYKLTGDKRGLNIKENLIIREKFDYHLDDSVDITKFVEKLKDKYQFSDEIKQNIEDSISFQIISHVEKISLKAKMSKLEKLEREKKFEEKRRIEELNNLHQYKDRIRKGGSRGNFRMGEIKDRFVENNCPLCYHLNYKSENTCRSCRVPIRLMNDELHTNDIPRKNALGFLSRMVLRSDLMKTFNLTNKLDYSDLSSLMTLQSKIRKLIMGRMDFDLESKEELIKMFENYMYNYTVLSLNFCDKYPFFDNKNDVSKERIQVVSEKRGKPGRPKKTEVIKKYLKKTVANPVGRPKMTEADKKKMFEARMRKRRRKMNRGKKGRFARKDFKVKKEEIEENDEEQNVVKLEEEDIYDENESLLGKREITKIEISKNDLEVKIEALEQIVEIDKEKSGRDEEFEDETKKKLKV